MFLLDFGNNLWDTEWGFSPNFLEAQRSDMTYSRSPGRSLSLSSLLPPCPRRGLALSFLCTFQNRVMPSSRRWAESENKVNSLRLLELAWWTLAYRGYWETSGISTINCSNGLPPHQNDTSDLESVKWNGDMTKSAEIMFPSFLVICYCTYPMWHDIFDFFMLCIYHKS